MTKLLAHHDDTTPLLGTGHQAPDCQSGSRREFLAKLAALGVSALVPGGALIAQTSGPATKSRLIDVHHHILPPVYSAEAQDRLIAQQQGYLPARILNWSPKNALAEMDQNAVATSSSRFRPRAFGSLSTRGRGCFRSESSQHLYDS